MSEQRKIESRRRRQKEYYTERKEAAERGKAIKKHNMEMVLLVPFSYVN